MMQGGKSSTLVDVETRSPETNKAPSSVVLVSVENLTKVFTKTAGGDATSKVVALADLSFQIQKGEFVTIVGPSGCGKTTLLRIIAGLIPPTRGQVVVNGKVIDGPGPDRSIVFQDFRLLPWRTCLSNVEFGLELQGVRPEERRVRAKEAVELVGLGTWADYYPGELSGGMQQRVGLARALAVNPEIFLMDEPFGALDAITRSQMQQELVHTFVKAGTQKTVLFVTHSIDEALLLGDRILVLTRAGRLEEDISLPFDRPRNEAELLLDSKYIEIKRHLLGLLEATSRASPSADG